MWYHHIYHYIQTSLSLEVVCTYGRYRYTTIVSMQPRIDKEQPMYVMTESDNSWSLESCKNGKLLTINE